MQPIKIYDRQLSYGEERSLASRRRRYERDMNKRGLLGLDSSFNSKNCVYERNYERLFDYWSSEND